MVLKELYAWLTLFPILSYKMAANFCYWKFFIVPHLVIKPVYKYSPSLSIVITWSIDTVGNVKLLISFNGLGTDSGGLAK